jgi:nicotinate dehydrogenase subunit A
MIELEVNGALRATPASPTRRSSTSCATTSDSPPPDSAAERAVRACVVLVDGAPACACTMPIADAAGKHVSTVEGLAHEGEPHPLQRAFLEEQAAQCGYCVSGMLMRAAALLASNPSPDDAAVRAALEPQLCRCGSHNASCAPCSVRPPR